MLFVNNFVQNYKYLCFLKSYPFFAAYLIVDPAFDREELRHLSEYVEENNLTHPVFTILNPFTGTDLYDMVKKTFITEGFELIDFFHTVIPTKLPLDEFYQEFLGLYSRAYPFKNFTKEVVQSERLCYV